MVSLPKHRDESGFIVVWATVFLTAFLGIAALAVDLGNWYLQISKEQRAADSAALAGAVYLPDDISAATNAAKQELQRNGFTGTITTIERANDDNPELLRVKLRNQTKTYFISSLGVKSFTFSRTAIAGERPPMTMGSPNNTLGRQPNTYPSWASNSMAKYQGNGIDNIFWLSQGSEMQNKQSGDRWANKQCLGADGHNTELCPYGTTNSEYDPVRSYGVKIPAGVEGKLAIEVFDGTYGFTGLRCLGKSPGSPMSQAAAKELPKLYADSGNDPHYNIQPYGEICTGDDNDDDLTSLPKPLTTFSMKLPKGIATTSSCSSVTFKPLNGTPGTWWNQIQTSSASDPGSPKNAFMKWSRICEINIQAASYDREIQVNSQDQAGASGSNRYSLRAAFLNGTVVDTAKSSKVSLYGRGRIGLRTSDHGAVVDFTLGRVPAYKGGDKVHVEFWDIGDVSANAGQYLKSIKVVPSDDWRVNGAPVSSFSCVSTAPKTKIKTSRSQCQIPNFYGGDYNGHVAALDVNIPEGFTCDRTSPSGCWMILVFDYGPNVAPTDTTTWSLDDVGTPLRLFNEDRF